MSLNKIIPTEKFVTYARVQHNGGSYSYIYIYRQNKTRKIIRIVQKFKILPCSIPDIKFRTIYHVFNRQMYYLIATEGQSLVLYNNITL